MGDLLEDLSDLLNRVEDLEIDNQGLADELSDAEDTIYRLRDQIEELEEELQELRGQKPKKPVESIELKLTREDGTEEIYIPLVKAEKKVPFLDLARTPVTGATGPAFPARGKDSWGRDCSCRCHSTAGVKHMVACCKTVLR